MNNLFKTKSECYDAIVIGAGAAGFMAAITAGKRGKQVLLLDHSAKIGEKIRISGGGRCNFTNTNANPENYICTNPHFHKSALAGYKPKDFITLIEKHKIPYHEKKLGQLFSDLGAELIIAMLKKEISKLPVTLLTNTQVGDINYCIDHSQRFEVNCKDNVFYAKSLVIASGGLSIPQIGATDFGYRIAKQFGIKIIEPRPALVPLVFSNSDGQQYKQSFFAGNAGLSFYAEASAKSDRKKITFKENILFTHKGLSGPAILQISSYWQPGNEISINLAPHLDIGRYLCHTKQQEGKKKLKTILKDINYPVDLHQEARTKLNRSNVFTEEFLKTFPDLAQAIDKPIAECSDQVLNTIGLSLNKWTLIPDGTEGFAKAEVTVGGIDTNELSSKTMESKKILGLYFIGEVVDVTGWLGGYNFQWAWASGFAAGNSL